MIEEQGTLYRSSEWDTQKSSPGKSDYTHDTFTDITPFFVPVPVFIFYQTQPNFMQFPMSYEVPEPQTTHPNYRTMERHISEEEIKIEHVEEINFNNKKQGQLRCINTSKQRPEYNQNQNRNVMPNLIRLVLNFALLKKKSQKYLCHIAPQLSKQDIAKYYKYAARLKQKGPLAQSGYVKNQMLKTLFGITPPKYFGSRSQRKTTQRERLNKKIMRILSMYFLNNLCVETIYHSSKMSKNLRAKHLSKRKRLISILRQEQQKQEEEEEVEVENDIHKIRK